MIRTDVLWRNGGRLLSVALLGGLALNGVGAPLETMDAHAHTFTSQSWLTLENGWLCRSWSAPLATSTQVVDLPPVVMGPNTDSVPLASTTQSDSALTSMLTSARGAMTFSQQGFEQKTASRVTHCSLQWHISSDGHLISDASSWVPNPTGAWPAITTTSLAMSPLRATMRAVALEDMPQQTAAASPTSPTITSVLVMHTKTPPPAPRTTTASAPTATQAGTFYTAPGGIGPWTPVPGHPSYGFSDFAGDPNSWEFGVCTWWGWYMRRDEPQLGTLGMAYDWIANARAKGMSVGSTPVAGATVVFQPGVQGAGSGGHVAHVEQLVGGGWFIISEMNFYWNGGGWGRVDYRYVHAGSGVNFIY